jgi:hypothetical protein
MNIRILSGMIFSVALMALFGCGGGGGGATPTIVSGVASKGPFVNGTVQVFAIDTATGDKEATPRRTVSLDPKAPGIFTFDITPYQGPILIEVTGTYRDEATGTEAATTTPLRAAISNATGNVTVNVTPLTELAVRNARKTSGALTAVSIVNANTNIAALFKVADITTTKPVDATDATATATATADEKDQSLVLAAISQLVKNSGNTLDKVLTDLTADISVSGSTIKMADNSTASFKTALFDFMTDTTKNKTGITDPTKTQINIGDFKIAHVQILTAGLAAGKKIGGIDFTFNLPAGVTVSSDSVTNQVTPGVVVVSGVAAAANTTSISLSTINQLALRTVLANAQGFGAGDFVDISCTIPATVTTPAADLKTAFTSAITAASPLTVTDITGAKISGVTLSAIVNVF